MKLIIICVFYPPLKSSAAVQIEDLVDALIFQGHKITILTADSLLKKSFSLFKKESLVIYRFKSGKISDVGLVKRTINEFILPFKIIYKLLLNRIDLGNYEGIISWSPSIFLSPLIVFLKLINRCPSYLILRDIFPRWARDLGLIKNKIIYSIFNFFFYIQFYFADKIGIQSEGNKKFIPKIILNKKINIEVLNNWYSPKKNINYCDIDLKKTFLKNRKIFIYAGNIGIAQSLETVINVAEKFKDDNKIGFLLIGRGTKFKYIKQLAINKGLNNILFHQEISNNQLKYLYQQCFCGLITLDERHKTHNIPGKLLSYLYYGLPVLAIINSGNDLIEFINKNKIGYATDNYNQTFLKEKIIELIKYLEENKNLKYQCQKVANNNFNAVTISKQIIKSFSL